MEAKPEVTLPVVDRLAEYAGRYLEVAEQSLHVAHLSSQEGSLHAEFFAGSGFNLAELQAINEYGADLISKCLGKRTIIVEDKDRRPEQWAMKYRGVDTSVILDPNEVTERNQLSERVRTLTVDLEGVDDLFEECEVAIDMSPSKVDLQVLVGLAVVSLTQALSKEDVKVALQKSDLHPDSLKEKSPLIIALFMVSACIGIDTVPDEGVGFLEKSFKQNNFDPQILEELMSSLSEARLISPILELFNADTGLQQTCLPVAGAAVGKAAEHSLAIINEGSKSTQSLDEHTTEQEALETLGHESHVAETTRSLARRAKLITEDVKSMYRLIVRKTMPFEMPPLPVAGTPLSQLFHDLKAEQIAKSIASRRTVQQETEGQVMQAIEAIRGRFFKSHKDVKKHPAGNSLTHMLNLGESKDNNYRADATSKDTGFALAGLMFTLTEQLETEDITRVFDGFFEAVASEIEHTNQLNSALAGASLESLAAWLHNNQRALIASNIPVFKAVGRGLRQYLTEKAKLEQTADSHQLVS